MSAQSVEPYIAANESPQASFSSNTTSYSQKVKYEDALKICRARVHFGSKAGIRMSPLGQELARKRRLEHLGDNLHHVCCRKGSQRLGADVAQCAKAQVKRRGGKFVWSLNDCYDVIPSLRPEYLLHGHSKRLRHLLEGFCPLRGVLSVFDALIGELGKHDIGYHRCSP